MAAELAREAAALTTAKLRPELHFTKTANIRWLWSVLDAKISSFLIHLDRHANWTLFNGTSR